MKLLKGFILLTGLALSLIAFALEKAPSTAGSLQSQLLVVDLKSENPINEGNLRHGLLYVVGLCKNVEELLRQDSITATNMDDFIPITDLDTLKNHDTNQNGRLLGIEIFRSHLAFAYYDPQGHFVVQSPEYFNITEIDFGHADEKIRLVTRQGKVFYANWLERSSH